MGSTMIDKTEAQPEALRLADRLDCDASDSDMGRKPVACTRRKAAAELRRLHAELQQHNAQLADETESASEWRRLALQFDGHRMQALSHLRLLTKHPGDHCAAAVNFLAAPPLSGEQVLADRLAQLSARQASPTVQVRPLDGSFTQSMAKVKRIPATPKSIAEHFGRKGTVELRPYAKHERNQWDTHLILIEGQPVGYANGPISLTPIEQEPLTDEQIEKLRKNTFSTDNPFCPCDRKTMQKAVRAAERAHGIGATNDNP